MVQFGLQIEPQFGFDYDQIRDLAHLCEDVGFSSIWCSDHLFLDGRSQERDCWEAWTTLTALAVETTTLRIGPLVSCVSYRHPSILAKIAACVDVMSGGRLEMGIGAGWKQIEYEAYGIPFPSAKERVDRLEDSLNIITKMWTEPEASFQGKYYEIDGAFCSPKPAQAPHPPVWIGGEGPRVLGLAARFADGINIGSHPSVERYADLMAVLEAACERQGRTSAPSRSRTSSRWPRRQTGQGSTRYCAAWHVRPGAVWTSFGPDTADTSAPPEEVADYFQEFVELGVEQFILVFPYGHEVDSIKLMAERALPRLQAN